jgi:initiation factor 1A
MPKNKGGKNFKRGKKTRAPPVLVLKDQNTAYARVEGNLGNGICSVRIISNQGDGELCNGHIRGKVRRAKFFRGDILLVAMREITKLEEGDKMDVDINYKYYPDQVQTLERMGHINHQNDVISGITFKEHDEFDYDYGSGSDSDSESESDSDNVFTSVGKTVGKTSGKNQNLTVFQAYDDIMPGYDSEEYEYYDENEESDSEIEYDKLGNTIPKEMRSKNKKNTSDTVTDINTAANTTANTITNTVTNSESDSDVQPEELKPVKLGKKNQKKLDAITDNSQKKKMEKQMMRKKKSSVVEETINFDDI